MIKKGSRSKFRTTRFLPWPVSAHPLIWNQGGSTWHTVNNLASGNGRNVCKCLCTEHKNIGKSFEREQKRRWKHLQRVERMVASDHSRRHHCVHTQGDSFFWKELNECFVCCLYDIHYSLSITKFNHSRLWCWTLGRKNKRNWKIKGSGSLFTGLTDEESIFITLKRSDIVRWTYNWWQVIPSVLLALWTPQPFGGASFCVLLQKTLTIFHYKPLICLVWLWCLCGKVYYQIWGPF